MLTKIRVEVEGCSPNAVRAELDHYESVIHLAEAERYGFTEPDDEVFPLFYDRHMSRSVADEVITFAGTKQVPERQWTGRRIVVLGSSQWRADLRCHDPFRNERGDARLDGRVVVDPHSDRERMEAHCRGE